MERQRGRYRCMERKYRETDMYKETEGQRGSRGERSDSHSGAAEGMVDEHSELLKAFVGGSRGRTDEQDQQKREREPHLQHIQQCDSDLFVIQNIKKQNPKLKFIFR